jgi:hypothetical protein
VVIVFGARRKQAAAVALIAVAAGAAGWWWLAGRQSDREQLDELVRKAEHGIETKSVNEIMDCVAPDYQDMEGLSRNDIWRRAMQLARSPTQAEIEIESYDLFIASPRARGRFRVGLTLREGEEAAHLDMDLGVEFEKRRKGWRRVWQVKSVSGYHPEELWGDYL